MQIGNNSPHSSRPGRSGGGRDIDLTRRNREGLQETAERAVDDMQRPAQQVDPLEAAKQSAAAQDKAPVSETRSTQRGQDRIELSSGAERIASGELPGPRGTKEAPAARVERVAELKAAFQRGDLHSPERLARAAERLLMSDE